MTEGGLAIGGPVVFLDPDGTLPQSWMFVIVRHPTGVRYDQQYGGRLTRSATAEGYLVQVDPTPVRPLLDEVFLGRLRGPGMQLGPELTSEALDLLRAALRAARFWTPAPGTHPEPLALDESELAELDEAWIPVLTPAGPGVLVWPNSD